MNSLPGPKKQWRGTYPGNYTGSLWQTFNIDLERHPGRVVLSNHMGSINADGEGLGVIDKFIRSNATATDQWFGIVKASTSSASDGDVLRNGNSSITGGTWASDNTSNSPNNVHDAVIHESANGEQRMLVSVATDIAILNKTGAANAWDIDWGSTVASGGIALQSTVYHPMGRLQRLVAIADKIAGVPVIHTLDKDDVFTSSRLTFAADYTIRAIYTSSNRFWIALQHDYDGKAKIIEWDGFSQAYNNEYDLVGTTPLTGFIVRDIPHFITEKGFFFRYNGGGFQKLDVEFNLGEEQMVFDTGVASNATIKTYGAHVDGDTVYLNVGAPVRIESGTTVTKGARRARSGIWIFNAANFNLYHHRALGERLANSTQNFGNAALSTPGAVIKATVGADQVLFASAKIFNGGATWATGTQTVIYRDYAPVTTALNRGYIITPYLPIEDVSVAWEALFLKFKRFIDSGNRIIVKWRVVEPIKNPDTSNNSWFHPLQKEGTWATTTTFTSAVPTGVIVGDEVEVMCGDNAGCLFKISALSATPDDSTTITVTIAEASPVSSTDKAFFRFDNFKTETAISATDIGSKKVQFTAPAHGEFVQLKIELRGMGVELDEMIPAFTSLTSPKKV